MTDRTVDRCPRCASDDLALVAEPDGDASGTWTDLFFECRCGERLRAALVAGAYQPVVDDGEPLPLDQQLRAAGATPLPGLE
jgi:hypothetical protein